MKLLTKDDNVGIVAKSIINDENMSIIKTSV